MLADNLLTAADNDIFTRSLGPYADCFSTSQVVRMIDAGSSAEELQHLLSCRICNDLVSRSSQMLHTKQPEQSTVRGGILTALKDLFTREPQSTEQPPDVAVLSLIEPVLEVRDASSEVCVTVALPCVDPNSPGIDASTLRLDGAIKSTSARVEPTQVGNTAFTRVTFKDGHLSKGVKKSLAAHVGVTDQVRVTGVFKDTADTAFAGTAMLQFVNPVKVSAKP